MKLTQIVVIVMLLVCGCSSQDIMSREDIQKSILSDDCGAAGGEIIEVDQENPKCPDDMEYLGMVSDVNCICACCKGASDCEKFGGHCRTECLDNEGVVYLKGCGSGEVCCQATTT